MPSLEIIRWQHDGFWYGYWLAYPDYWTQGTSLADLDRHLDDLRSDIEDGAIPGVPRSGGC